MSPSDFSPLVCLITSGHVASTPRLVKNASALSDAGFQVQVVAGSFNPSLDSLDAEILRGAQWRHTLVNYGAPSGFARKLLRQGIRRLGRRAALASARFAARAHNAEALHLAAVAARQPARLYLGHCLAGLPAAAFAARKRAVAYGWDAEDFHDAETEEAVHDPVESGARRLLQSALLPGCSHLTSASPLIGLQFERAYGVKPMTLLNVFPLAEAPAAPVDPQPVSERRPARLYWFSQTVGPGRGLERIIRVAGRMRTPVEFHLRGTPSLGFPAELRASAQAAGFRRQIVFLPAAAPSEMARLAASADLGLSTEESRPKNRDICLTNKVFTYLLAGIPQLLSETSAQRAIAPELGASALLCDLSDVEGTASRLDAFFSSPDRIAASRRTAWDLALNRYCWDREKEKLLVSIRGLLPS